MPRAFIIRPFGKKKISDTMELDFELVHCELIRPALEATGFGGGTTAASDRGTDTPVFKMLPALREIDPDSVKPVPGDFAEEVARATAAKAPGWLRLLAEEVAGRRFERPALRLIGKAQWLLKDYSGARRTWQRVADSAPGDVDPNLALSNIFERIYKENKSPELLERSNLAITRVLKSGNITPKQRAEALALEGRNVKTLWRLGFESLSDLDERRRIAMSRAPIKAYESYRAAFLEDLNHYWSGLAALQMGIIVLNLAMLESFEDAFETTEEATKIKGKVERQTEALRLIVAEALDAELQRSKFDHPDRVWAEISRADLLFLTEERRNRIIGAYRDAVPQDDFFAWDAVRGQLQLFRSLGIRAEIADEVILTLDPLIEPPKKVGLHLIVFAGHQIDLPKRRPKRFPPEQEAAARQLICDAVEQLRSEGHCVEGWASAASGNDILFHQVCRDLKVESRVYLPMPKEVYARLTFGNGLDGWRTRFLELVRQQREPVTFSDREGLPNWLVESGFDPWERGNRWMLEMAQTAGAERITLLALWDGQEQGEVPGGTAHMVQIARAAGTIHIVPLDARPLVARGGPKEGRHRQKGSVTRTGASSKVTGL